MPWKMAGILEDLLLEIYHRLYHHFGPQGWWPAETPFEVCVGAILTQNTNWQNVEKALAGLKARELLSPEALAEVPLEVLAELIRPAGYFRVKAQRLKHFLSFLMEEYQGKLELMAQEELETLRPKLLAVKGIGPETADSILLYALEKPVFVVDAYTKRLLLRHGLTTEEAGYHELQELFMRNLPRDPRLYNEYHALLVACGKTYCLSRKPRCAECCLEGLALG